MDYIDEQKRYPKASAKFIKKWFEEHVAKDVSAEDILCKKSVGEDEEVEDTTSETSTEGRSPITRLNSSSITSEGSVTPEYEPHSKLFEIEKPIIQLI